jgi:site-specific DNA-methyltransferase (adenine-specific)
MTVHYRDAAVTLHHGDCLDVLREIPDSSVDAVVTDPPYGLEFMGREWDGADGFRRSLNPNDAGRDNAFGRTSRTSPEYSTGKPSNARIRTRVDGRTNPTEGKSTTTTPEAYVAGPPFQHWCEAWATQCLRVLKPGGHMLAFGGSRTWHRLTVAIEDAGFEIRDSIAWLYGSGFPKSLNLLDEQGDRTGWGTALKPAFEPIVVGRKPFPGTVATNVLEHGTGALNIDTCRTGLAAADDYGRSTTRSDGSRSTSHEVFGADQRVIASEAHTSGRWPTNVVLDESQAAELDKQTGTLTSGYRQGDAYGQFAARTATETYGDSGGASRFFPTFRYEAKAPTSERPRNGEIAHPTVKPLDLMRWLVRLVTPPGGTVLEPFAGSGTTAEACVIEGFKCIAIEREADYLPLIVKRLSKPIQIGLDFEGGAA